MTSLRRLLPRSLSLSALALALSPLPAWAGPFDQPSPLPFHAPDFAAIKDADFKPAIEQGIAEQLAEITAIANNPAPATFANTIEALELAGQKLDRVNSVFSALVSANTNPVLDKVDEETAAPLAALRDATTLNPRLFGRVKLLWDGRAALGLAPDQMRLLALTYQGMVNNGAQLSAADKETLKALNGRLSTLSTQFGQKLTAGTRDAAPVFAGKAALAGASEADIAAAAKAAEDRKAAPGSVVVPLQNTTQQPLMDQLTDRASRQKLLEASLNRSERGDANDTRALIVEIARLRAEKAKLLGFPDYASFTMVDQMAKNPATALGFLGKLSPAIARAQHAEAAELEALIRQEGGTFKLTPADWPFYAEKLRKAKYDLDQAQIRPYFEITQVLEKGVFFAANQLYGLSFKRRTDLPVYHPDVSVYEVSDADGTPLALFYFDPWKRDNKQGGAWMSNFVGQSTLLGLKPVVYNVENFTKPAEGQPALITSDDVRTMFHEFGHALHGMLSNQRYPSIAGANTARDFVEFPSQFNENWAFEPRVLASYARHYQTGEPMPAALLAKIKAARTFDQAYAFGEAITSALLDLKWHSQPAGQTPTDVNAFEKAALAATGMDVAHVPPRYRTSYFRHIWSNGYAAAYYAYSWTEMLDHDAFQWFETHGGMTRANGQRFRDMILSKGKSEDYATMYRAFAGRDPQIEPLLKARGLLEPVHVAEPRALPAKPVAKRRRKR